MKILSLEIASFGKLQNKKIEFSQNPFVLSRENAFGKTTIAAFIRAMLYGFKYVSVKMQNGARETDALHWQTWKSTGKIGGSMTVENDGVIYRIERYFGLKSSQEMLNVVNAQTGAKIDVPTSPGEMFLGLTAESFDRSAYLPQEAVELSSNGNFDARLAGLVQNTEDFDGAMSRLNDCRRKLKPQKGANGEIDRLENEKLGLQRQMFAVENNIRRKNQITQRLAQITEEKQNFERNINEFSLRCEDLQKQIALAQPTEEQKENEKKLSELSAKLENLRDFETDYGAMRMLSEKIKNAPEKTKVQKSVSLPLLIVGIILVVAGIGVCFAQLIAGICVAAIGAVCFVLSFFVRPAVKTLPSGEKDAYISQYYALAGKYVDCADKDLPQTEKDVWQAYTAYIGDKREFETLSESLSKQTSVDGSALINQREHAKLLLNQAQRDLRTLEHEEGALTAESNGLDTDCISVTEKLSETEEKLTEAKRRLNAVLKVTELLQQAKENLSTSYLPPLAKRCSELLNLITKGEYEVCADRNFVIMLREKGVTKPLECFSRGIREITLLCFRIALSEMLFGEIPLLIVDDAFVNFDEENFLRATALLKELSKNTQIIYFTCHNRLGKLI